MSAVDLVETIRNPTLPLARFCNHLTRNTQQITARKEACTRRENENQSVASSPYAQRLPAAPPAAESALYARQQVPRRNRDLPASARSLFGASRSKPKTPREKNSRNRYLNPRPLHGVPKKGKTDTETHSDFQTDFGICFCHAVRLFFTRTAPRGHSTREPGAGPPRGSCRPGGPACPSSRCP